MGFFTLSTDRAMLAHLDRIERKLEAILEHLQIDMPDDGLGEVRQLAESGNKIAAIKRYRELTGASLVEAKNFVERGS